MTPAEAKAEIGRIMQQLIDDHPHAISEAEARGYACGVEDAAYWLSQSVSVSAAEALRRALLGAK